MTPARAGRAGALAWLALDVACTALFVVEAAAKLAARGVARPLVLYALRARLRRAWRGGSFSSEAAAAAGDADGEEQRLLVEVCKDDVAHEDMVS